jgi:hypothetical protein
MTAIPFEAPMRPAVSAPLRLALDSRRRLTLPAAAHVQPGDFLHLEVLPDGKILLTPVLLVPKRLIEQGVTVDDGKPCHIFPCDL